MLKYIPPNAQMPRWTPEASGMNYGSRTAPTEDVVSSNDVVADTRPPLLISSRIISSAGNGLFPEMGSNS